MKASELTVTTICIEHCIEQGILPKSQAQVAQGVLKDIYNKRTQHHLLSELEEHEARSNNAKLQTVTLTLSAIKGKVP